MIRAVFFTALMVSLMVAGAESFLSPIAMVGTDEALFIACATTNRVLCQDLAGHAVSASPMRKWLPLAARC
jgi:hypothetical protein